MTSETNNDSPGNDGLTAKFYKNFSNQLAPILLNVMTLRESLGPWVLFLEQGSYLPYINKVIKKIFQTKDPSHF